MGSIMGSQILVGLDYGNNISEIDHLHIYSL
jgi:hypothetical protein